MSELVGGNQSEVVVMNSLTVNLHLLMHHFIGRQRKKFKS
jgi:kynureninase